MSDGDLGSQQPSRAYALLIGIGSLTDLAGSAYRRPMRRVPRRRPRSADAEAIAKDFANAIVVFHNSSDTPLKDLRIKITSAPWLEEVLHDDRLDDRLKLHILRSPGISVAIHTTGSPEQEHLSSLAVEWARSQPRIFRWLFPAPKVRVDVLRALASFGTDELSRTVAEFADDLKPVIQQIDQDPSDRSDEEAAAGASQ